MGVLVIPLSIFGLSIMILSILIGVLLMAFVEKTGLLKFLSDNIRTAIVMTLALVIGGFIIAQIWLYYHFPLI